MNIPGILISAPASGSGKTAAACALMAAFLQRGLKVRACKCGPDYIDPMFHREILGIESQNLDLFFSEREQLASCYIRHGAEADLVITEGVMGYYDGMGIDTDAGSSFRIAESLKLPVLLVIPARGAALSLAASVRGMLEFRAGSSIRGILLNRVSASAYPRIKKMLEKELAEAGHDIPVLGYLPDDEAFSIESRHLGLVTPMETEGLRERLRHAGEIIEQTADLERILRIAETAGILECGCPTIEKTEENPVKIGIARDEAFCFYYRDNLELLEQYGCKFMPFSPLHDRTIPEGVGGLLIGGGYPELYAGPLSRNREMLASVRTAVRRGMPCIAECGGFMYLHETLEDKEGNTFPMAGIIKGHTFPSGRLTHFGYVTITAQNTGGLLETGEKIRGHEFHYWKSTEEGKDCIAEKPDKKRNWNCIHMTRQLYAGYPHLYYPSEPEFARRFVEKCQNYQTDLFKGVRHF